VVEAVAVDAHDPETEARKLMEIMQQAGILNEPLALGAGDDNE
jgi:hypothetical protein